MLTKIKQYIKTHIDPQLQKTLLTGKPNILVGLSGGPDSVFLLHFLHSLQKEELITLSAAHLNHGWRKEANNDEDFCKKLCDQMNIPLLTKHAQDLSIKIPYNGSKEEVGRKLRRHFFSLAKIFFNADYVSLAHHQQDQQETFFIRLIRGCSLQGLTAIKPVQGFYVRPLLQTNKEEIVKYLREHNILYQTDETNLSDDFLRNRIRNHVIPALKKTDERFDKTFKTSLKLLDEENNFIHQITLNAYKQVFDNHKGDVKLFATLDPVLQKRILMQWLVHKNVSFVPSRGFLEEMIKFITSPSGGTHHIHQNWSIKKKQSLFWITKN